MADNVLVTAASGTANISTVQQSDGSQAQAVVLFGHASAKDRQQIDGDTTWGMRAQVRRGPQATLLAPVLVTISTDAVVQIVPANSSGNRVGLRLRVVGGTASLDWAETTLSAYGAGAGRLGPDDEYEFPDWAVPQNALKGVRTPGGNTITLYYTETTAA